MSLATKLPFERFDLFGGKILLWVLIGIRAEKIEEKSNL
jgi:hypothetical protein